MEIGPLSTTAPSRRPYNPSTSIHPFIHVCAENEVFPLRESLIEDVPGSEVGIFIYFEIDGTVSTAWISFLTGSLWKQMEVLQ